MNKLVTRSRNSFSIKRTAKAWAKRTAKGSSDSNKKPPGGGINQTLRQNQISSTIEFLNWSQMILYNPKPWIRCYSMKWLLNSYCQYSLILTFRPIWGFWRCSELIPHTNKHGVWHQNQVSSMARSKVRNFLLEVVLDLLHPILDIQVNLRPLKMVPNDSPCQKTWGLTPKPCL